MGHAERATEDVAGSVVTTGGLGGHGSLEEVAAATFRALLDQYGAARAGLALTVPGGRQLRFISSDHALAERPGSEWCLIDAYAELPLNDAVRTGEHVVLPTREALAEAYPELAEKQQPGIRSVLALSLGSRAQRLGGVVVYLEREVDWPRLGPRLSALAAEVSNAIVAARSDRAGDAGLPQGHRLPADETAAGLARRFLRETLGRWEVTDEVTYAAQLCASEIVTNVVMHAACPSVISADRSAEGVTVEIRHPVGSTPRRPDPGRDHDEDHHDEGHHDEGHHDGEDLLGIAGRGLAIVDAIAAEWGNEPVGALVRWWFRLG